MSKVPPIRIEVEVEADPFVAFEVFTGSIGRWWPLADLSVFGEGATVAFVDGDIVERSADGQRSVWGTVTRWQPGVAVEFTWHPGKDDDRASLVSVTFAARTASTVVTLVHSGWEAFETPDGASSEYEQGWPTVLGLYKVWLARRTSQDETWVVLLHRPGPRAPSGPLFKDPRFQQHLGFLQHMRDAGYLVSAGPFSNSQGEGMTILRLPGSDQVELAERLARQLDQSVASGFLTVEVRPWEVALVSG